VFLQRFDRIDEAFKREKQIQKWTREKKEALIEGRENELPLLAKKKW
jgi:putative endonuclease